MSWSSIPFQKPTPKRESELLDADLYKRLQQSRELNKQIDADLDEMTEQSILEDQIQSVASGGEMSYQKPRKSRITNKDIDDNINLMGVR